MISQPSRITERTLIPISLVISILGGVGWLTKIYFETEAHGQSIVKLEQKADQILQMREDIAVIRTKVEALESRK